jgi:hypothetical protein
VSYLQDGSGGPPPGDPPPTPASAAPTDSPERTSPGPPPSSPDPSGGGAGPRAAGPFDWALDRTMRTALVVFVGFVAVFTFVLRPYDTFNLGIFLYEGSYTALGQNPYAVLAIPGPPNLQLLGLGAYLSYAASGYNLSGAVVFYKVANGVFAALSALIVANIAARLAPWPAVRTRVFVALLLSPPIFFFSFVHVQLDIFGIFWSLLGIYLFFFTPRLARWDFLRVVAALVLLAYAVYAYTIPIAFFPALIIYEPTWRRRLFVALASGAALLLFVLPNFALWSYLPTNPIGATAAAANSPYSLPFVLGNFPAYGWGFELLILWGVLTVLLPVLLRWWKVDVFGALIVSAIVVFLVLPIYNGDEFIWVLPWLTLGLAIYSAQAVAWSRLILVQLVLLPLIVVFNFYDGLLGMGTGIFYLFYPQFSNGTVVYQHIPHAIPVAELLMGSVFAGLIGLAVLVIRRARRFPVSIALLSAPAPDLPTTEGVVATPGTALTSPREIREASRTGRIATASPALLVAVFVVLLVAVSVAQPAASVAFQATSPEFPTGMFLVHPPPSDNLSYSLINGGDTIVLPPTDPAHNGSIAFIRNTTGERMSLGLTVVAGESGKAVYNTTILNSTALLARVISVVTTPPSASPIAPALTLNVSGAAPPPANDENVNSPTYTYSGASLTQYDLPSPTGPSTTYSFFFEATELPFRQNVIWSLTTGYVTSELVAYPTAAGIPEFEFGTTVSPGVWDDQWVPLTSSAPWNLVEITASTKGLTIALDGLTLATVPSWLSTPHLDIGRFSANASTTNNDSFEGLATEPVDTAGLLTTSPALQVDVNGDSSPVVLNWDGDLELTASGDSLAVTAQGREWTASGSTWLAVGRLSPSTVTLYMTVSALSLRSESANSLFVPFLLLALVAPIAFVLVPRLPSWLGPRRGGGGG